MENENQNDYSDNNLITYANLTRYTDKAKDYFANQLASMTIINMGIESGEYNLNNIVNLIASTTDIAVDSNLLTNNLYVVYRD